MYLENAYKRKENQVRLRTEDGYIIVDLSTMKEYPEDDTSHKDNVVRKEKVTGQWTQGHRSYQFTFQLNLRFKGD
jgi:hypothetical protein